MSSASSTFVDADGDGYERLMGRWSKRLALPFLDFAGTADGERVLDVGCGTGSLTFALSKACPQSKVHGIDFSSVYIRHAGQHNTDARLTFEVGDACALALPDKSFDRVLSLLMLHFVPDAQRAIVEMRRVVRPGGIVAAAVWDIRGGLVANRIFFDTVAALDPVANERRAHNYTRPMTRPGELASAWRAAGLTDVSEQVLSVRMEFQSFDDYWTPYAGKDGPGAAYLSSVSDSMRTKLRDAVSAAYLDGEADGPRSFAALAWAVRGVAPLPSPREGRGEGVTK